MSMQMTLIGETRALCRFGDRHPARQPLCRDAKTLRELESMRRTTIGSAKQSRQPMPAHVRDCGELGERYIRAGIVAHELAGAPQGRIAARAPHASLELA